MFLYVGKSMRNKLKQSSHIHYHQFGSLRSTLAIQLGNISQEILDAFQRSNFTCLSEDNEIGPAVEAVSMLTIYRKLLKAKDYKLHPLRFA